MIKYLVDGQVAQTANSEFQTPDSRLERNFLQARKYSKNLVSSSAVPDQYQGPETLNIFAMICTLHPADELQDKTSGLLGHVLTYLPGNLFHL